MTFEEYLTKKKIDSVEFLKQDGARWKEWASLFEQLSEPSFTAQKLYLINPVRRKYPLKGEWPAKTDAPAVQRKPAFKPKIQ